MGHETEGQECLSVKPLPLRAGLLREAEHLTCGDRHRLYGEPAENMQHIAEIFNTITGRDITPDEAAMLHVATKLARMRTSPDHRDSHVDAMNYLGIHLECIHASRC